MKSTLLAVALLATALASPSRGESYEPTAHIGEFLRQFATAYQVGDQEWIRSAVDPEGIVEEAKAPYFGFLGPKEGGEPITGLSAVAAPDNYQLPNSLLNFAIQRPFRWTSSSPSHGPSPEQKPPCESPPATATARSGLLESARSEAQTPAPLSPSRRPARCQRTRQTTTRIGHLSGLSRLLEQFK